MAWRFGKAAAAVRCEAGAHSQKVTGQARGGRNVCCWLCRSGISNTLACGLRKPMHKVQLSCPICCNAPLGAYRAVPARRPPAWALVVRRASLDAAFDQRNKHSAPSNTRVVSVECAAVGRASRCDCQRVAPYIGDPPAPSRSCAGTDCGFPCMHNARVHLASRRCRIEVESKIAPRWWARRATRPPPHPH